MHRPSRGAFQRSLTLLVRYRSRGVFSLPRGCLGSSQRISDPCYSGIDANGTVSSYGVVTLFHAPFQETSDEVSRFDCQPEHHIGPKTFGLGCVGFTRGYSRHRCCVLVLPLLRCFNSGSSLLRVAIVIRIPIRRSRVLSLHAGPTSFSQLGTSFVGSRAEPFTSWHSSQ